MDKLDLLRLNIKTALISGVPLESKVEDILKLFQYSNDGLIIGWLEIRVKPPLENEYIDIRWNNGTIAYERLATSELLLKMRQDGALWRPFFTS